MAPYIESRYSGYHHISTKPKSCHRVGINQFALRSARDEGALSPRTFAGHRKWAHPIPFAYLQRGFPYSINLRCRWQSKLIYCAVIGEGRRRAVARTFAEYHKRPYPIPPCFLSKGIPCFIHLRRRLAFEKRRKPQPNCLILPLGKLKLPQQIDMTVKHQYNDQKIDHRRTVHRSVGDRKRIACRPPVG